MANSWVEHCRKYAKKNKCTYKEATKLGKSSYQSSKKAPKKALKAPKKALKEPKPKKQVKKAQAKQAQAKQAQAKQADKRTRKMECLKQAVESLKVKSAAKQARMAAKKEQKE